MRRIRLRLMFADPPSISIGEGLSLVLSLFIVCQFLVLCVTNIVGNVAVIQAAYLKMLPGFTPEVTINSRPINIVLFDLMVPVVNRVVTLSWVYCSRHLHYLSRLNHNILLFSWKLEEISIYFQ